MSTVTINNKNVQEYINKQLIDPYSVKIDLNATKTASDNVHRWVTLADAIKSNYKFNFDYDIKDLPSEIKTLPEVTVTAPMKMYSVGAGEMRPFNSVRQASEYAQQHPKKDASESALNWLLAGMIAAPAATTIATAGYIGDRLFHDAVQAYNGEDIDKNGMWVCNPGGWIAGYTTSKVPQATKALYSFGRTNIGAKGSRLSYVLDKNLGNLEVPKTLDFGGIKRFKWGDAEFDNPNLYYHIDKGNYKGFNYPKIKGGYLKQGYFYPGDSPNKEQIAYSWWNKGNPYTFGNAWKRLIISEEKPQFIHVRSQPYKIGQWDPSKKKSFVINSEYVASQPVKISPDQVFYFDKYRNGWYRPPARMRYIFGERPSTITTAERMGIPKSERHLRTHGHDYSNPSSYGKLYQNGSVNPESNQFGKFIDEGSEASVFDDPTNPHMVLKVNTDWKGPLQEFYTNYVLKRNRVPNQKPIILRGITEEGFPVFNQEKVTPMTYEQYLQNLPKIREMLHNKGFIGDPEDLGYMSNGVMKIGDFNPGNVAFDSNGNIVFIDIDAYKRGGKINEKD